MTHGGGASSVACADGSHVAGTLVLDATGHARKLVEFDAEFNPGYQVRRMRLIAYMKIGSIRRNLLL